MCRRRCVDQHGSRVRLAAFCGMVMVVASAWIALGAGLAYSAGTLATPRRIWRIAAVGLAGFAVVVAASAIGTMH